MIAAGAYWANRTWGSYWSWDPKETWAAITWLVYAGYLHMRVTRGWRGRRAAYFAILGFAVVMFTFLRGDLLAARTACLCLAALSPQRMKLEYWQEQSTRLLQPAILRICRVTAVSQPLQRARRWRNSD